jgi:hypothetical protein
MNVERTGAIQAPSRATAEPAQRWVSEPMMPAVALTDAESVALASSLALVDGQLKVANDTIRNAGTRREAQIERAWRALQEANRQAQKKSGWASFGNICKIVGIGASIAAAGASGGSSLMVTAALLAASMSARHVLQKTNLDVELVEIKGMKLTLSDAVLIAAAVGGGFAAGGDSKATTLQKVVGIGARGTQTGATAGQAVAAERVGYYESRAINCEADSRAYEYDAGRQQREIEGALARLRENMELRARAIDAVMNIQNTKHQALSALVGRRA